jgi:1,4-dihydroxy-2-naphthoyl-CoA hydrolase
LLALVLASLVLAVLVPCSHWCSQGTRTHKVVHSPGGEVSGSNSPILRSLHIGVESQVIIAVSFALGQAATVRAGNVPAMGEGFHQRVLSELAESSGLGSLPERMGIAVTEASPQRVVGTMPVEGNTQPFSLLHGGASCVLAESLGSIGASLHALETIGGYALGVEISATHHRGARAGVVTGVATPLHLGSTIATYEVVITNESGDRVCTARLTCLLRRP